MENNDLLEIPENSLCDEPEQESICSKKIIEAIIFTANKPITPDKILALLPNENTLSVKEVQQYLDELQCYYESSGIELIKVASGYRFQVRCEIMPSLDKVWEEKPARYTRALLETLAIIVYRQPVTRGEIEEVRGVNVSSQIMRTLQEREWIRIVGRRDVPGRPAMYATTRQFLDYFNLESLKDLPTLMDIQNIENSASEPMDEIVNDQNHENIKENVDELNPTAEKQEEKKAGASMLSIDYEQIKEFREEKEQQDNEVFSTIDELLENVKTDFTDCIDDQENVENAGHNENAQNEESKVDKIENDIEEDIEENIEKDIEENIEGEAHGDTEIEIENKENG